MGVCLYLALMKRLFGDRFKFALLDDVVMSVDSEHRYEFCRLLKAHFPDTQFIITTHDRVWAEQMKSAGLVTSKTSLMFHGWSIEAGPVVESNKDVWGRIAVELGKGNVGDAAGSLRRHLEYASRAESDSNRNGENRIGRIGGDRIIASPASSSRRAKVTRPLPTIFRWCAAQPYSSPNFLPDL